MSREAGAIQVCALEEWLALAAIDEGALFRRVYKGGGIGATALSDKAVNLIVKRWLARAEITGLEHYSAHSLRAGFITTAAQNGVPEWLLQRISRHVSTAVLRRYVRSVDPEVAAVVSSMLDVVAATPAER